MSPVTSQGLEPGVSIWLQQKTPSGILIPMEYLSGSSNKGRGLGQGLLFKVLGGGEVGGEGF